MECLFCDNQDVSPYLSIDSRDYYRCSDCQLTFLDPGQMPDADTERAHYELHNNDIHDPNYRAFLRRLTNPLLEHIAPASYGLDYGCGPGPALAEMLSERGYAMELYDPIFADDEDVFEEQYDFITCSEAAEHFHHPLKEFSQIASLLKPGGWLGIMTSWLTEDTDFSSWHYRRDPTHVCFFSPHTLRYWARSNGWTAHFPEPNIALLQKPPAK